VQLLRDEYDEDVRSGAGPPEWPANPHSVEKAAIVAYLEWLMDRDRKSPGLKLLQGMIWKDGYRVGSLRGQVFPDVPRALARWREHEMDVRIFSSGSVLAQRLLFETTPSADLTKLLNGYFDTGTGPKTASASYHRIAAEIDRPPIECLFVSDVVAELDAAQAAGMQTLLSIRPGNAPQAAAHNHGTIRSFDEIVE
jgi:enolase-phosphatase E1